MQWLTVCRIFSSWVSSVFWGECANDPSVIEEIPNAAVEGPKIMIQCVLIGIVTGFIFLMVLLFVSGPLDGPNGVITSAAGPLLQIFYNATGSQAGAICLLM